VFEDELIERRWHQTAKVQTHKDIVEKV